MFIKSIIENFKKELDLLHKEDKDSIHKSVAAVTLCQDCLSSLRDLIGKKEFSSKKDEIHFFKIQKQIPQSELVYQVSLKHFYFNSPRSNKDDKIIFCNTELTRLNTFFRNQRDFYQYVQLKRTDLDSYYFTRPSASLAFEQNDPFFRDPKFSTARDISLSRLTALQRYIDFINDYKRKLAQDDSTQASKINKKNNLEWTGSKTALTELIYALYARRIINNGTVDIKEIASTFSRMFNYELGDFYKTYAEIKSRKISRTKFLDEISASLISQMERSEN